MFRRFLIVLISVIASIPFLTSSYSVGTITLEEFQDARNGFFFCPKLLAELCTFALQLYVGLSCHKHQLIGELKSQLKTKQDEYKDQKIQYEGIQDFLNHSNVENYDSVSQRKNENSNQIQKLNELLEQKKKQIGKDASGTMARELSENVIKKKNNLKNIMSEILNQE